MIMNENTESLKRDFPQYGEMVDELAKMDTPDRVKTSLGLLLLIAHHKRIPDEIHIDIVTQALGLTAAAAIFDWSEKLLTLRDSKLALTQTMPKMQRDIKAARERLFNLCETVLK